MKLNKKDQKVLVGFCAIVTLASLPAILFPERFWNSQDDFVKIIGQSGLREQYLGDNVGMFVTATGSHLEYQWKKGGVDIRGATASTLILKAVTLADAGIYTCVVKGRWNIVTSTDITVNIFVPETARESGAANRVDAPTHSDGK